MSAIADDRFVFNVVWTGTVFTPLRYFVASQLAQCGARFRFVANGCAPEQVALMEQFQGRTPDRVVEVLVVDGEMKAHGVVLDLVRNQRDDGEFFALIDPDIAVSGPFLAAFAERLEYGAAGVSSGRGIWRDDDYVPAGHPGVSGEYFYDQDGFLFGSPHFALYRRAAVEETSARWRVGFGSAGPELTDEAKQVLRDSGRDFLVYDTAKLLNFFLQHDGNRLEHFEHRNLMHIGGLSHYLAPSEDTGGGLDDPVWPWPVGRLEVARYCGAVLSNLVAGLAAPPIPDQVDPAIAPKLQLVRATLVELVETYGPAIDAA